MSKGTNFHFGKHAPRDSLVMTPKKIFVKGAWLASRDPVNYGR